MIHETTRCQNPSHRGSRSHSWLTKYCHLGNRFFHWCGLFHREVETRPEIFIVHLNSTMFKHTLTHECTMVILLTYDFWRIQGSRGIWYDVLMISITRLLYLMVDFGTNGMVRSNITLSAYSPTSSNSSILLLNCDGLCDLLAISLDSTRHSHSTYVSKLKIHIFEILLARG